MSVDKKSDCLFQRIILSAGVRLRCALGRGRHAAEINSSKVGAMELPYLVSDTACQITGGQRTWFVLLLCSFIVFHWSQLRGGLPDPWHEYDSVSDSWMPRDRLPAIVVPFLQYISN
ncbi:hypothetical protein BDU57DRAFT_195969 [Ampelomyces quisqualis]|uniref:Uncharacterized protein n=1 Tax=Ampelomyces quisqualis TaxID=50730 RepID=A0A6A5QU10_AMPQU|nr:hypothetical protein BDU57DRAFT_195969 [Ampelomyces quisqualis]